MGAIEDIQKLVEALNAGGYNVQPSELRQGTLSIWHEDGTPATFEEYEQAWNEIDAVRGLQTFLYLLRKE